MEAISCEKCRSNSLEEIGIGLEPDKPWKEWTCFTLRCTDCDECYLVIKWDRRPAGVIHLRDFLKRRGDGPGHRPLNEMSMAKNLSRAMLKQHERISPATLLDFGIRTKEQFTALMRAVHISANSFMLDRVLGDGKAITALVRYISKGEITTEFVTPWDALYEMKEWQETNCEGQQ